MAQENSLVVKAVLSQISLSDANACNLYDSVIHVLILFPAKCFWRKNYISWNNMHSRLSANQVGLHIK